MIFFISSNISNMRKGKVNNLIWIRWIRYYFLVTSYWCIKTNFSNCNALIAYTVARKLGLATPLPSAKPRKYNITLGGILDDGDVAHRLVRLRKPEIDDGRLRVMISQPGFGHERRKEGGRVVVIPLGEANNMKIAPSKKQQS